MSGGFDGHGIARQWQDHGRWHPSGAFRLPAAPAAGHGGLHLRVRGVSLRAAAPVFQSAVAVAAEYGLLAFVVVGVPTAIADRADGDDGTVSSLAAHSLRFVLRFATPESGKRLVRRLGVAGLRLVVVLPTMTQMPPLFFAGSASMAVVEPGPGLESVPIIHDGFCCDCPDLRRLDLRRLLGASAAAATGPSPGRVSSPTTAMVAAAFGNMANAAPPLCTAIGHRFAARCPLLRSVDLSRFERLARIGDDFLAGCASLTDVRLPVAPKCDCLGAHFLAGCGALVEVDLSPLGPPAHVGHHMLYECESLRRVNLGAWPFVPGPHRKDMPCHRCPALARGGVRWVAAGGVETQGPGDTLVPTSCFLAALAE